MRRPPSSASSAGGQWAQFDPFRHIHAPLPQHIEHGLRNVFQLLDTKGEGQVPFGEVGNRKKTKNKNKYFYYLAVIFITPYKMKLVAF